jgi:hypothetical protein
MKTTALPRCQRRTLVLGTSFFVSMAAVASLAPRCAWAAKAQKADVNYRANPNNGKSCASCRLFTPAGPDKGTCAAVEGDVSPRGWCMAYSPL